MARLVAVVTVAVVVCASGLSAQAEVRRASGATLGRPVSAAAGQLHGTVHDERGQPVPAAVVSVVGVESALAVTDGSGRFLFKALPPGSYLIRAHQQGFLPVRAALVQVNPAAQTSYAFRLERPGTPHVTMAGVAGAGDGATGRLPEVPESASSPGELAWRLRHLKRGVLDDATFGALPDAGATPADAMASGWPRRGSAAARVAATLADLPFSGQLNLLTGTTFDRPQELLARNSATAPHGVAYASLQAPSSIGQWYLRGALTQGDLSSWTLAGAFVRDASAAHAYEAGMAYTTQRYDGGNPSALAAMPDGSRNVGALYGYDHWKLHPRIAVDYGARYARYDYLTRPDLLSPSAGVSVRALGGVMRGAASMRSTAPGAEEFEAPGNGMWLPPERTFAALERGGPMSRERTTHLEASAQRPLPGGLSVDARLFRQRVDDQLASVFGLALAREPGAGVGHYYVASTGGVTVRGWGAGVSRSLTRGVHGSVEYTESLSDWDRTGAVLETLAALVPSVVRAQRERLRDVAATVEADVRQTATRLFVFYRVNVASAQEPDGTATPASTRFDVQVRQALPFLNFTSADWAMLVTVRNVFTQSAPDASVYDELLVVRPPKRIVGGLTVRF